MKYSTKSEFISGLREALYKNGVSDTRDILLDFDQHFDDGAAAGETEAEVCEKLGDVEEIAKQYISDEVDVEPVKETASENKAEASGFDNNTYSQPAMNTAQPSASAAPNQGGFTPDGGAIAGRICVDVFVFSWAIPALFSVILGFYSAVVSIGFAGLGVMIGGIGMNFMDVSGLIQSPFSSISTILLGLMLMALCGLLVSLCFVIGRGFVDIIKSIINWHSRAFVGRNVVKTTAMRKAEKQNPAPMELDLGGVSL